MPVLLEFYCCFLLNPGSTLGVHLNPPVFGAGGGGSILASPVDLQQKEAVWLWCPVGLPELVDRSAVLVAVLGRRGSTMA